ncbi:DNA-formamidopyrimidine glycosylase family protein [Aequorivita sp. SDUM287046]|uniref:DNA-formamidopyrimidine glycosylase family protein n=1 Tax=Aequorivita aurantiaca TaxID=3053356 RepID=A0ABT8DFS9_9FLAO|nr:DNA-formamidopyrimidine glycosylase family protein [Aequorivita aurantiaca]MDN3724211.1 DNA-formamidopyrimidine glycosylase family protein [Aequorivita aurantiaca]
MPELPEIAHAKKFADKALLNKKVRKISFGAAKPLQAAQKKFKEIFEDQTFTETQQLGKYLFAKSDSNKWLVLHFGMSGKLDFSAQPKLPKHAIITFHFKDDTHFSFVCPRKFGKVWIADSVEKFQKEHELGPDALSISKKEFLDLMEKQSAGVKSVLMDQHKIAGIGNVYTDEILFQSHIHPKKKVSNLSKTELNSIHRNITKVLKKATQLIDEGEKSPDNWLKSHRDEGDACPNCKGKIKMIKIGGRSTYFCEGCQKL